MVFGMFFDDNMLNPPIPPRTVPKMLNVSLVGGFCTNPFVKICSSIWIISPRFGVNMKKHVQNHHLPRAILATKKPGYLPQKPSKNVDFGGTHGGESPPPTAVTTATWTFGATVTRCSSASIIRWATRQLRWMILIRPANSRPRFSIAGRRVGKLILKFSPIASMYAWKAKESPIFKAIVAGFRGKVA